MATEILRPNAAGDETNLTPKPGTGEENWEDVDEAVSDDDTTRVQTVATTWVRDLYNLPAHSEGSGTISKVTVKANLRTRESPNQTSGKLACKTGGTAYEGNEETLGTTYAIYSKEWITNPNTSSAWTWNEVDALQIGVSIRRGVSGSATSHSHATQAYVEVDYTAVTEKTSSDAGSGVDAVDSLQTPGAKSSSDAGSGLEGTPVQSATLVGSETGSGIEAFTSRLLAAFDTGTGTEVGGLLKSLLATELGQGSDCLTAKIEMPTKGGGMKLWM